MRASTAFMKRIAGGGAIRLHIAIPGFACNILCRIVHSCFPDSAQVKVIFFTSGMVRPYKFTFDEQPPSTSRRLPLPWRHMGGKNSFTLSQYMERSIGLKLAWRLSVKRKWEKIHLLGNFEQFPLHKWAQKGFDLSLYDKIMPSKIALQNLGIFFLR